VRIAINTFALSSRRGIGGPGRYQLGLLGGLAKLSHSHSIYVLCNADNVDLIPDSPAFTKVLCGRLTETVATRILWEHLVSPMYLKRLGIDVLHSTNFVSPYYVPCCSVLTLHDMTWFLYAGLHLGIKRRYFQTLIPLSVRRSQGVVAVSQSARQDIINLLHASPEQVNVIYHGIDTEQFRPLEDETWKSAIERKYGVQSKAYILYVGGIHPRKNVTSLVKAFEILKKRGLTQKLLLVGSMVFGNKDLLATIDQSGQKGDVVLAGQAPDAELPALYTNASVAVYPSFYEGFGFPVLEAMACGTPVVTSAVSSLPEVAGDAGLIADPHSVEDLAEKIWRVLTDPALRECMRARGRKQATRFTWEETARRTLAVYEQAYDLWKRQQQVR
jgi:glycosyltransferase involved in cell wall biosynthesis